MIPGPRHTAPHPAPASSDSDLSEPAQHSGYCSSCQVTEPFDSALPLIPQLRSFLALHEHPDG